MNGDIGKLPPGAGYASTPESLAAVAGAGPGIDYTVMNGGPAPAELMLDTGVGSLEPIPQLAMGMGGAVGYVEMTPLADVSAPPTQMPDITPNIPIDQLKQMLSSQLEYYFSRENLANDTYLLSQMDNDQYVPIWTVANFNQVKKLTKDIKLITEVLRESPNVQVDEEGQKVRPNHKRCIVILREIPDSTPLEDVKNLFSGEGCPRFISCEFAHNSSWYVTFESDEDAQKAYRFLREEVREFQGKPIMARIKAKPMNRLPMTAIPSVGGMKNGYRTPPPQPVYGDPSSYQPGQQRFLYTNGTTMPQTTMPPYPNQVVYHQPFYPAGMMPWGPASPAYFDMTSVFTMNGIASHSSFKPHNTRFNSRNSTYSRNKQRNGSDRGGGGGGGGGLMDSGGNMVPMARTSHPPLSGGPVPLGVAAPTLPNILPSAKPISSSYSTGTKFQSSHAPSIGGDPQYTSSHVNKGSQDSLRNKKNISTNSSSFSLKESEVQPQDPSIQFPRHRTHRRTKDPETLAKTNSGGLGAGNASGPPGSNALPSSVGKEASSSSSAGGGGGSGPSGGGSGGAQHNRGVQFDLEASAFPPLPGLADASKPPHNSNDSPAAEQQTNRLSDVVKGTAKLKSTNKEKELSSAASSSSTTAPAPTTTTTTGYHHQQYHHQPHHHHHHHHHHQQQQQHHHQHHQQHQTVVSSSSGASNVTRSTSPGNNHHHHHHQQHQPRSDAAIPAANSNTPAPAAATNAAAAAAAAAGGESDVALGTVTLTPPSSPDK